MIPSLSIGPRTLLNDCNHSATAIFWRSAILTSKKLYQSHWERHACILPADTRPSRPGYHSEVVTYPGWMCSTRKRRDACLNRRFMPRSVLVTVSNRAWLPSLAALRR